MFAFCPQLWAASSSVTLPYLSQETQSRGTLVPYFYIYVVFNIHEAATVYCNVRCIRAVPRTKFGRDNSVETGTSHPSRANFFFFGPFQPSIFHSKHHPNKCATSLLNGSEAKGHEPISSFSPIFIFFRFEICSCMFFPILHQFFFPLLCTSISSISSVTVHLLAHHYQRYQFPTFTDGSIGTLSTSRFWQKLLSFVPTFPFMGTYPLPARRYRYSKPFSLV